MNQDVHELKATVKKGTFEDTYANSRNANSKLGLRSKYGSSAAGSEADPADGENMVNSNQM